MNIVVAEGGSQKRRRLAEDVTRFCIQELMPRIKTLSIYITLSKNMMEKCNADGFCLAESKRDFEIEVDASLNDEDFITVITHEMTHVKQYARGELKIGQTCDDDSYHDVWYEREAYQMQEILYEKYLTFIQK